MGGLVGFVDPTRNPQAWDKIVIGGKSSPGVIPPGGITGFSRTNEWDVKKGKGAIGGTITFVQQPPSTGKITIVLGYYSLNSTPAAQWAALDEFLPLLQYDPTKKVIPPATGVQAAATTANAKAKAAQQLVDDLAARFAQNPPRTAATLAKAQQDLEDARIAAATALRAAGVASVPNVSVPAPVKAIDIYHPSFASSGVKSVVTVDISPIMHIGRGKFEITFEFLEYRPPTPASAVSTPSHSQSGPVGGASPNSNAIPDPVGDRNDKLIADLLKKAKEP